MDHLVPVLETPFLPPILRGHPCAPRVVEHGKIYEYTDKVRRSSIECTEVLKARRSSTSVKVDVFSIIRRASNNNENIG